MQDFKTTVIAGSPSDGAHLLEALKTSRLDVRRLSLRVGLFGTEPWSETLRQELNDGLGIDALDCYDLSEIGGSGVAGECPHKNGLHLAEDHYLAEIIDPESGKPLPDGQRGELVLTTLTKEALPLLRFRTHDLTTLHTAPCACGRTLSRLARISSRTDGLLFAQGFSFHPARITDILQGINGVAPHFLLTLSRKGGVDELEMQVEVALTPNSDSVGKLLAVEGRISEALHKTLGLNVKVRLVEPQTFTRITEGVATKVMDMRE